MHPTRSVVASRRGFVSLLLVHQLVCFAKGVSIWVSHQDCPTPYRTQNSGAIPLFLLVNGVFAVLPRSGPAATLPFRQRKIRRGYELGPDGRKVESGQRIRESPVGQADE